MTLSLYNTLFWQKCIKPLPEAPNERNNAPKKSQGQIVCSMGPKMLTSAKSKKAWSLGPRSRDPK